MRIEYQMTPEEMEAIKEASKPVPYLVMGGTEPSSPQENANRAWKNLADARGFVWDTVEPVSGKGYDFFTAEIKPTV